MKTEKRKCAVKDWTVSDLGGDETMEDNQASAEWKEDEFKIQKRISQARLENVWRWLQDFYLPAGYKLPPSLPKTRAFVLRRRDFLKLNKSRISDNIATGVDAGLEEYGKKTMPSDEASAACFRATLTGNPADELWIIVKQKGLRSLEVDLRHELSNIAEKELGLRLGTLSRLLSTDSNDPPNSRSEPEP